MNMKLEIMELTKQQAGQLGGLTTYLRYGRDEMSRRGQLGGRPQLKTLLEMRQQPAPIKKRRVATNDIKELLMRGELVAVSSSPLGREL